ncbi:MAG: DUF3808 domain-containing protein [Candidatus Omnitrophica bacterium]|nr:DUF3808 domain-containing protein [Candidatus Omnitrophota bacterium]
MSNARIHYNRGNALRRQGKDEQAIKEFEKALSLDPSFWLAKKSIEFLNKYIEKKHISFGNLYESEEKLKEAVQEYKKAFDANPHSWRTCKKIGFLYKELNELDKASYYIKKAIKISPTTSTLYLLLGHVYDLQEKYPDAIATYNMALRFSPQNKEILHHKKLTQKINVNKNILNSSGKSVAIYTDIASLFLEKNMSAKAIAILKKALHPFPDSQEIHFMLGNMYYNLNDFETAYRFYKKTLTHETTVIPLEEIHYNIAIALASCERWKEALKEWEQCIKLSPRSQAALRAKANLELFKKKCLL